MKFIAAAVACVSSVLTLSASPVDPSYKVAWAEKFGSFSSSACLFGMDKAGNFYVCGYWSSSWNAPALTIGNQTLTNRSVYDATNPYSQLFDTFVAKFSPAGELDWVRQIGGNGADEVIKMSVDNAENVYLTGYTSSTNCLVGTNQISTVGGEDFFIAKYDSQGNALWVRQAGGSGYEVGTGLDVDPQGNVFVAGTFNSPSVAFGTNILNFSGSNSNQPASFLAKYNASGDLIWARSVSDQSYAYPINILGTAFPIIKVNHQGHIVLAGSFQGAVDLGGMTLTNSDVATSQASFIANYDEMGNLIWARQTFTGIYACNTALAIDAQDNIYDAGYFCRSTVSLAGIVHTNQGFPVGDSFLTKYDPAGNLSWSSFVTGTADESISNISIDGSGNPYIFGYSRSSVTTFGIMAVTNQGAYFPNVDDSTLVAKYAPDGNILWARTMASTSLENYGSGLVVDNLGNIFVAGNYMLGGYTTSFTFGEVTLPVSTYSSGYFLAKINGPMLSASSSGNQLTLSWPTNAVGLHLEGAASLNGPWSASANAPTVTADQNSVSVDASSGSQFFRLNGP